MLGAKSKITALGFRRASLPRELGLLSESREGSGRISAPRKYLQGGREDRARLLAALTRDGTRGEGHKPNHRRLCLITGENFFTVRMTERWQSSPREPGDLGIFQIHLDVVLGSQL